MVVDLLKIPDSKELKQMRAQSDQVVARMKARKWVPRSVKPDEPASPKESDSPYSKRWRDYWQFPGGLGLNIPSHKKSKIRLKRIIPVIRARQEAYLRDPVAYIESLTTEEIWRFTWGMPKRVEAYRRDPEAYIESLKVGEGGLSHS